MSKFRELSKMPFDKEFELEDGNIELCHATGYEMLEDDYTDIFGNIVTGQWWNEYQDSNGAFHYGR